MKIKTVILLAVMAVISAVAAKKAGDNSVAYAPTVSEEELYFFSSPCIFFDFLP